MTVSKASLVYVYLLSLARNCWGVGGRGGGGLNIWVRDTFGLNLVIK